jgi:hypothetical protein
MSATTLTLPRKDNKETEILSLLRDLVAATDVMRRLVDEMDAKLRRHATPRASLR